MHKYDLTILTDARYVEPSDPDWYARNILQEDGMVKKAMENRGYKVFRTNWDNVHMDWSDTRFVLFRTTWDYFDRFPEFDSWLNRVKHFTRFINPLEILYWNLDKHYLLDLEKKGIRIPPTQFIEKGEPVSLEEVILKSGWTDVILKPAISGAARHTYRINRSNIGQTEALFAQLLSRESMMIQEFQENVVKKGEVAFMVFDGVCTHAVLKRAKKGDFRVQDDHGGTVHDYSPSKEETVFAETVAGSLDLKPVYARVDVIRDNQNRLCVSELEMIEPELWFRRYPPSVEKFADAVAKFIEAI